MIRLEARVTPCQCKDCGYVVLDLSELGRSIPQSRAELQVGKNHLIRHAPNAKAVISDERPGDTFDPRLIDPKGRIAGYVEDPCSVWETFIVSLYQDGYRWFWLEEASS